MLYGNEFKGLLRPWNSATGQDDSFQVLLRRSGIQPQIFEMQEILLSNGFNRKTVEGID